MNNHKIFYLLVFGFGLGIFLSSFFKIGFSFFLFLLLLSILIYIFGYFFSKEKIICLFAIFLFFFALGILRYEIKEMRPLETVSDFVGKEIVLQGVVSEEPSLKEKSVQLIVSTESVSFLNKNIKVSDKVLVTGDLFPEFKYGDLIKVRGILEEPKNFLTEAGKEFDYIGFLAKEDVFYRINFAKIDLISSGKGSLIKEKLFMFKKAFTDKLNLLIKEPESSLLGGLLLGAKNSLGQNLQNDFRIAGVSHIVALSGYNITIVAESIMIALSFLPRAFSFSFGALGIVFFAIMTGGTATVVRASLMALLVLLARATGRKSDITRALLLAGVFMLVQNPKILVFDISFQLSFLATLALILVSPIVEKKLKFITEKYKLRELIVATIATQIFVLPFLLYKMGVLSVFALFANILILPVIPIIMFLGFFTGFLGFFSFFIATPIAFICSLLLSYVLKTIDIFSHLPFSSINIDYFPVSFLVIIYIIFAIIIWKFQESPAPKIYEK